MNPDRLGPYHLDRRIGRGGMGSVFAATVDVTGESAAVKVLTSLGNGEDGLNDRFAAEIDSLRMLNHPNIVRILGYGDEEGFRYYAMELVAGRSLQEALAGGRQFSWQESARIGVQICRALKHAHDRGIVHRDIKPANLLLKNDGTIKLSDFGIAKLFGNTGMTADGGVIGTAEYMAPEQADGRPATYRSDLYSLGGVLYALLAGRPPFRAATVVEMLQLQRFAEPEPITRIKPAVPRALSDLVLQLLQKDPAKRMPSAMVTSRALEAILTATGIEEVAVVAEALPDEASPVDVTREPPGGALPLALPVEGSLHDTTDFRVSPLLLQQPSDVALAPEKPQPTFTSRTYTPVARDEHRKFEHVEEETPVWISPQTWGLVAAMLSIGLLAWYWLQPPSAEKLYDRIRAAALEGKSERLVEVEHDIADFQRYYPGDRRMREMESYVDEIELYHLERKFMLRSKIVSKNEGLSPVERAYVEAIGYVHLDPTLGRKKLHALIELFRDSAEGSKTARECLSLARRQLDRLEHLAAEQAADDLKVIDGRLRRADELQATDPEAATRIRRAVIELYEDEPWAEAQLAAARAALQQPVRREGEAPAEPSGIKPRPSVAIDAVRQEPRPPETSP